MVLTMFTVMIFQSIAIDMEWFVELPLGLRRLCSGDAVYLVEAKRALWRTSPVLKIFSPLFCVTLTAFLVVMLADRSLRGAEFLIDST